MGSNKEAAAHGREPASTPTSIFELPVRGPRPHSNRRVSPRVAATFKVRSAEASGIWTGVDISSGGMMCLSEDLVWPGNLLSLHIELPGNDSPVHVNGRVVDLVPVGGCVGMRIQFERLGPRERENVAKWIGSQRAAND